MARTLWLTGTIEAERTERGAATGVFTIVVFFAGVFTWTGLAVMSYLFFRRGRITDLVGMLAGCSLPLWAGLTGGQRETTAQVMLTVLMARYFVRRRPPPRLLVVPTIVLAMVVVPVIGEYRSLASERGAMAVFEFDVVGQFEKLQTGERAPEMALAGMVAGVVDRTGAVNYGAGYWNNLVFRFVPAQIVGADLKQSLYLGAAYDSSSILDRQLTDMNGTTMTGIADSYMEFGYLGWGAFLAIGVVQRYLLAACERGSVTAILLSCASSTCAIRALTHQTVDYLPTLLSYTVVLLALAWYARKPV